MRAAWKWDLDWINAHGFTDNVADLMAKKFDRLPETTQETLQQLACLGSGTDASIFTFGFGGFREDTVGPLGGRAGRTYL